MIDPTLLTSTRPFRAWLAALPGYYNVGPTPLTECLCDLAECELHIKVTSIVIHTDPPIFQRTPWWMRRFIASNSAYTAQGCIDTLDRLFEGKVDKDLARGTLILAFDDLALAHLPEGRSGLVLHHGADTLAFPHQQAAAVRNHRYTGFGRPPLTLPE